jgi:hypothetical protein
LGFSAVVEGVEAVDGALLVVAELEVEDEAVDAGAAVVEVGVEAGVASLRGEGSSTSKLGSKLSFKLVILGDSVLVAVEVVVEVAGAAVAAVGAGLEIPLALAGFFSSLTFTSTADSALVALAAAAGFSSEALGVSTGVGVVETAGD